MQIKNLKKICQINSYSISRWQLTVSLLCLPNDDPSLGSQCALQAALYEVCVANTNFGGIF